MDVLDCDLSGSTSSDVNLSGITRKTSNVWMVGCMM